MGALSKRSIPPTKAKVMQGTKPAVPKPKAPMHNGEGCLKDHSGGRVNAGPRGRFATPSVHE